MTMHALFLSPDWVNTLGWALVHSLWQFAVVALVAGLLQRALRGRSATLRYGVLLVALAGMVVLPFATWLSLRWTTPPVPAVAEVDRSGQLSVMPTEELSLDQHASPPRLSLRPESAVAREVAPATGTAWWQAAKERIEPYLAEIVGLWLAGVWVVALRPLLSWRTVRRLRREGVLPAGEVVQNLLERTAQRLQLARAVEVLQSTLVQAPAVVGYLRPVVLLPASVISGLSPSELEAILAHELAHIRRHDYLVNLVQTVVETLFFYHPAVWWLSREIRQERENCCDDLAMAALGSRADYGRALLAIEQLRSTPTTLSLAVRGGSLLARMRRIAGLEPTPSRLSRGSLSGVLLVLTVLVAIVAWSASLAVKTSAAEAQNPPDALALLAAYERTLLPYQQVKINWTARNARLTENREPKWDEVTQVYTVLRAADRAKTAITMTDWMGTPGRLSWYEHLWKRGETLLGVGPSPDKPEAVSVISQPAASEEDYVLRSTGFGFSASFGRIYQISIPGFLRAAKLSASRETLEGHAVEVLRGTTEASEITLWLDPALGYVARKLVYVNRHPDLKDSLDWCECEFKQLEQRDGIWMPKEEVDTYRSAACPKVASFLTKEVNGKLEVQRVPEKDANGQIVIEPPSTSMSAFKLIEVDFHPNFRDEDSQPSHPIPEGTKVTISMEVPKPHIHHEWRQGQVVQVVEPDTDARAESTK